MNWCTTPPRRTADDRQLGKRFGDHVYAAEELVAEIGSAFLCAQLGVALEPRPDHAVYIGSWIKKWRALHPEIGQACDLHRRGNGSKGRRLAQRHCRFRRRRPDNPHNGVREIILLPATRHAKAATTVVFLNSLSTNYIPGAAAFTPSDLCESSVIPT